MLRSVFTKRAAVGALSVSLVGIAFTVFAQNKPAAPNPAVTQPRQAPPANASQPSAPPASTPQPNTSQAAASANAQPAWSARCASISRQAPLECTLDQQVVVQATRQQISFISVRVPGDTRQPVMMIQLPLGLYLPAGLTLQIDEGKAQVLAIQSCDQRACYVGLPVAPDLLDSLKKGQRLNLAMQTMNREPVTIVHPLAEFGMQYQKIQ
ncbi:invasion associated locus B family protein [Rhizobiales bacterium TNE-4]|nr:invasion associated locus B family protein [Rhizobiales bacterium TNE-4]MBV1828828.1 invasion associated locus B family protein [Rhizobiales bacterium TNE-4]